MGVAALVFYTLFIVTPLKRLRQIEREQFENRHSSHFYYLTIGMQASLVTYMVDSFFASVAYQWYVYYLVAYAICLRRIYDMEHGAAKEPEGIAASDRKRGAKRKGRAAMRNQLDAEVEESA